MEGERERERRGVDVTRKVHQVVCLVLLRIGCNCQLLCLVAAS